MVPRERVIGGAFDRAVGTVGKNAARVQVIALHTRHTTHAQPQDRQADRQARNHTAAAAKDKRDNRAEDRDTKAEREDETRLGGKEQQAGPKIKGLRTGFPVDCAVAASSWCCMIPSASANSSGDTSDTATPDAPCTRHRATTAQG